MVEGLLFEGELLNHIYEPLGGTIGEGAIEDVKIINVQ